MKILYIKDKEAFGYYKISAIKPDDFIFGEEELNSDLFGILQKDLSDEEINEWANHNKYCINNTKTGIKETDEQYQIPEIVIPKEVIEEGRE